MDIVLQQDEDNLAVEELLDLAFGKDRYKKAAYAFRRGVDPVAALSFVIKGKDELIATLRFWPVFVGSHDALMLGPIAVKPELQGHGHGIRLMKHGLQKAREMGYTRVILVGDEQYYGRLGFNRDCVRDITMKGQDDVSRLLGLELLSGSFYRVIGDVTQV